MKFGPLIALRLSTIFAMGVSHTIGVHYTTNIRPSDLGHRDLRHPALKDVILEFVILEAVILYYMIFRDGI